MSCSPGIFPFLSSRQQENAKKKFLAASLGVPSDHPRFINDLLYENQGGKSIAQKNTLLMLLEVYTLDMLLINLQIFE